MWNWFKGKSPAIQIITVLAIVIIVFVLFRQVKKLLNRPTVALVNWGNIPTVGTGSNGQSITWNPDILAKEIFEKLEGYNLRVYPETIQKILDLQTDDQVKLLYNHYNQKYAKDYPSLTQLIDNEWADSKGIYKKAVARLKGLGLT